MPKWNLLDRLESGPLITAMSNMSVCKQRIFTKEIDIFFCLFEVRQVTGTDSFYICNTRFLSVRVTVILDWSSGGGAVSGGAQKNTILF